MLREHIICSSFKTPIRPNLVLLPYVHPQTDHATFWPTPFVHQMFCPLWQFSTVTLWPCDIFLLWHSDSVTIFYCDTSTMWHFYTVTFWVCDNFLLWHFDHVTFFYCDIPSQSRRFVHPPQKVAVLSLLILILPVDTLSKLQLILTNDNLVTLSL